MLRPMKKKEITCEDNSNSVSQWLGGNEAMAEDAMIYFQAQFHEEGASTTFGI